MVRLVGRIQEVRAVAIEAVARRARVETLAQTISAHWWESQKEAFPYSLAASICASACEGLHAAHELRSPNGELLGLVHRDVAPGNIMVGYDGLVRLMDFGVVKIPDQLSATRPGLIKGRGLPALPRRREAGRGIVDQRDGSSANGVDQGEQRLPGDDHRGRGRGGEDRRRSIHLAPA
jgi:serine/threonine protein kinase